MAEAKFENDTLCITGKLDFYSVQPLYQTSIQFFNNAESKLTIDFSAVTAANSAALALIVDWIKLSIQVERSLSFKAISPALLSIAGASGMKELLQPYCS